MLLLGLLWAARPSLNDAISGEYSCQPYRGAAPCNQQKSSIKVAAAAKCTIRLLCDYPLAKAGHQCLCSRLIGIVVQKEKIYPHIASHDAAHGINAAWLRCLTDANFKFSQWGTQKTVRLNVV